MRGMRNKRGITLIALVITIIIVFILAGTTINMITSQDGILNKTILAKDKMNEGKIEEKIKLAVTEAQINENGLDREELKKKLEKYFGSKYTLTVNSDSSCVINVDGIVIKVESNGVISNSKYEVATSEDGILLDASGDNILDYKIYGDSVQNGEPTPDNPVEIQSVGDLVTEYEPYGKYKIPVTVNGKNLLPDNVYNINDWNYVKYLTYRYSLDDYIKDKEYVTLSFKHKLHDTPGTYQDMGYFYLVSSTDDFETTHTDMNFIQGTKIMAFSYTFKVEKDKKYKLFWYGDSSSFENIYDIQLERGTTVTAYEQYKTPVTTNIYLKEPLRKVGTYADYIDFKSGKIIRNIKNSKISELNFLLYPDWNGCHRFEASLDDKYFTKTYSKNVMSNVLATSQYDICENNSISERKNYNYLRILTTTYSTLDELNSAIGSQFIAYVLATPTEETIELPEVLTHKGTNIIEVDTTVKPSKIEMTYYKEK